MKKQTKKRTDPESLLEKFKKADIAIEHDGNFTIAVAKYGKHITVGVAKKSPVDPMVPERGETIAKIRALRKLEYVVS